jgi:hypothetical protein
VSEFTVVLISAPIIAISICIISDFLKWRSDVNLKLLFIKATIYMLIFGIIGYPFSFSFVKDGASYRDVTVAYIFGFGYVFPMIGKLLDLLYIKIIKSNPENE